MTGAGVTGDVERAALQVFRAVSTLGLLPGVAGAAFALVGSFYLVGLPFLAFAICGLWLGWAYQEALWTGARLSRGVWRLDAGLQRGAGGRGAGSGTADRQLA